MSSDSGSFLELTTSLPVLALDSDWRDNSLCSSVVPSGCPISTAEESTNQVHVVEFEVAMRFSRSLRNPAHLIGGWREGVNM